MVLGWGGLFLDFRMVGFVSVGLHFEFHRARARSVCRAGLGTFSAAVFSFHLIRFFLFSGRAIFLTDDERLLVLSCV